MLIAFQGTIGQVLNICNKQLFLRKVGRPCKKQFKHLHNQVNNRYECYQELMPTMMQFQKCDLQNDFSDNTLNGYGNTNR